MLVSWDRRALVSAARRWARSLWTWALIALLACSASAQSQPSPGFRAELHVGFAGRFRHGAWTPVAVDLTHVRSFEGTLEVAVPRTDLFSGPQTYVRLSQPITLAPNETLRVWLTLPLRGSPYPLQATVKDREGRVVATLQRELRQGPATGPIVVVLDPSATGWGFLGASSPEGPDGPGEVVVAELRRPMDLPSDPLALSSVTALIVRDTFPLEALSPEQLRAIATYVKAGGHLIVTGGSSPPAIPLEWLGWLPATTGRVKILRIDTASIPFWELAGPESDDGEATPVRLWLTQPVGAGQATIIAYDPTAPVLETGTARGLRVLAAQIALGTGQRGQVPEILDDDIWNLVNQIEVTFGNNQLLTVLAILYALSMTAIAFFTLQRPARFPILVLFIAGATWYAWHYTQVTGVRDQVGFAHVQLTRGVGRGIVLNRSYALAVSMAHYPVNLEIEGPMPRPFPAFYQADRDIHATVTPTGIRFEKVMPSQPIRIYHDSIEEIDIHVRPRVDERSPLVIVNNSDYELRYVHYVERTRLAPLGHVPARTTMRWTDPSARAASAGWMGMTLQSGLLRQRPEHRPEDVDVRLLALAADRGLGESWLAAEADRPFIVALIEPRATLWHRPTGQRVEKRVLIMPAFDEASTGGWSGWD